MLKIVFEKKLITVFYVTLCIISNLEMTEFDF